MIQPFALGMAFMGLIFFLMLLAFPVGTASSPLWVVICSISICALAVGASARTSLWKILKVNHDQLEVVFQAFTLISVLGALYIFVVLQGSGLYETEQKTIDIYIDNSNTVKNIDNAWQNIAHYVNEVRNRKNAINQSDSYYFMYKDVGVEEQSKMEQLVIKIDGCLTTNHCDIDSVKNRFCKVIFEWATLLNFDRISYNIILTALREHESEVKKYDLLRFTNVIGKIDYRFFASPHLKDIDRNDLITLYNKCIDDKDQYRLYNNDFGQFFFVPT